MIVVFDIDGTLANNSHRQSYIASKPKNWKAFNATMHHDTLHEDIAHLLDMTHASGAKIIICTGRSDDYRKVTEKWLEDNDIEYYEMYMRKEGDYRADSIVKVELLNQIIKEYEKPHFWFDDRQQVVDAIRAEGIRVLQVAPGDF